MRYPSETTSSSSTSNASSNSPLDSSHDGSRNVELTPAETRALLCPDPLCVTHLLDRIKAERKLRDDLYLRETEGEWDRWGR